MKYISLNWTLALKFSVGNKKRMRDCRILMAHDCIIMVLISSIIITRNIKLVSTMQLQLLQLHLALSQLTMSQLGLSLLSLSLLSAYTVTTDRFWLIQTKLYFTLFHVPVSLDM